MDVGGMIEECGEGVTQFSPGEAVYARTDPSRNGAYAEYVLARAEEVAAKPKMLGPIQAGAMPHAALTAWTLVETANLSNGQTVLIHGAAGGVGHLAVQFAKLRGARVIGTASRNIDLLHEIGVDEAINYETTLFESVARNVDAVFDTVGGETQQRSWAVLKPGGFYYPPFSHLRRKPLMLMVSGNNSLRQRRRAARYWRSLWQWWMPVSSRWLFRRCCLCPKSSVPTLW